MHIVRVKHTKKWHLTMKKFWNGDGNQKMRGFSRFLGTLKWPRKKWDFTLHPQKMGNLHQNGWLVLPAIGISPSHVVGKCWQTSSEAFFSIGNMDKYIYRYRQPKVPAPHPQPPSCTKSLPKCSHQDSAQKFGAVGGEDQLLVDSSRLVLTCHGLEVSRPWFRLLKKGCSQLWWITVNNVPYIYICV